MDQNQDESQNSDGQQSDPHGEGVARIQQDTASAGPVVIDTENPEVTSGGTYRTEWSTHPDRSMVIETSRIKEPNGSFNPGLVMVPVPVETPDPDHGDSKKPAQKENQKGDKSPRNESNGTTDNKKPDDKQDDQKNEKKENQKGESPHAPSKLVTLLLAAAVALVCGVAGAAGYSYFLGPDKSGDKKSSSGDSTSSKKSDSSSDSGSSKKSGSSDDSGSSDSDSGSSKQSDASEKGSHKGDSRMAEQAWIAAVKELRDVQASEKSARQSEADTKAVLDFFKRTMLSAGRPGDASLSDAFWAGGHGKDVTLRKAIDSAESQTAQFFSERPTVEATVRELLGFAYLNLGEAPAAVTQYQRALAVREATQGASQPETAAVRNQLAVAYRMASRATEAAKLFDRNLNTPAQAAALAVRGSMLLNEKKPAEAELMLRDCLTIRQKIAPDDWSTFDTRSHLGQALLDQNKFADAEPMLVTGYEGMKARQTSIPAGEKPRMLKALERVVKLYELWGKADEAMKWRNDLEAVKAFDAAMQPS